MSTPHDEVLARLTTFAEIKVGDRFHTAFEPELHGEHNELIRIPATQAVAQGSASPTYNAVIIASPYPALVGRLLVVKDEDSIMLLPPLATGVSAATLTEGEAAA